ncbi:hypothetical protein GOODEAATRI_025118, partial [Goodea atripinnis]
VVERSWSGERCLEEAWAFPKGCRNLVTYWDVCDGSSIRDLEGSQSGAINGMHITQDGSHFVTGMLHGASISCTRICSNNCILVSASADGGIWRWKFPHPPSSY